MDEDKCCQLMKILIDEIVKSNLDDANIVSAVSYVFCECLAQLHIEKDEEMFTLCRRTLKFIREEKNKS